MIDELIERVEKGEGAEQVIAAQQLGIHAVLAFMDALTDLIPNEVPKDDLGSIYEYFKSLSAHKEQHDGR